MWVAGRCSGGGGWFTSCAGSVHTEIPSAAILGEPGGNKGVRKLEKKLGDHHWEDDSKEEQEKAPSLPTCDNPLPCPSQSCPSSHTVTLHTAMSTLAWHHGGQCQARGHTCEVAILPTVLVALRSKFKGKECLGESKGRVRRNGTGRGGASAGEHCGY